MHRRTENVIVVWLEDRLQGQGQPMHHLRQVVGLYILIEIAPDVVLDLFVALLGILHRSVLVLSQPLLHNSLKHMTVNNEAI